MANFDIYSGNLLSQITGRTLDTEPYFFDEAFSLQELVGKVVKRMNEGIIEITNMTQAIATFEAFVIEELSSYDSKIVSDVTTILNQYIADGTITNLLNQELFQALNDSITNLTNEVTLLSYKEPALTFTTSPSQTVYGVGDSINSIVLNFNIVKGTNPLAKAEIYKNDVLLTTLTNIDEGTNTYTDGNIINSNTSYYIKIYDDKNSVSSEKITLNFVNSIYYGVAGASDTINEAFIKNLNPLKFLKTDIQQNFNCANQKIVFAYPNDYDTLKMIFTNNDEDIESYTMSTLSINNINYNVYVSNNYIMMDNIEIMFAFNDLENSTNNDIDNLYSTFNGINNTINDNIIYSKNSNKLFNSLHKMQDGLIVKGVAHGDSITWGQIPTVGGQSTTNYPSVLQSSLRKIYDNNNISIVNEGQPGQTTTYGLANIDTQVISQAPDFCIMMWGTNDCTARLDLVTFKDNIRQMVKKCIKANIEVLLLTCHPVYKSDDYRMYRQQLYAKAIIEVAKELDVAYINMFEEITNLIVNKIDTPIALNPDSVHFDQSKYYRISDIIINKALYINDFDHILEINKDLSIPIWHSPHVKTDINSSGEYVVSASMYGQVLAMTTDGTLGTYVRFVFFNKKQNQNLVLIGGKNTIGGQVSILDNGVAVNTIDFYSTVTAIHNVPNTIIENLSYGLHIIEILSSNMVKGKATSGVGKIYLEGFQIIENKSLSTSVYGSITSPVIEGFTKVIDGSIKFSDNDSAKNSQILLSNKFVELKSSKTLEIEIQGTFFSGSGVTWFNNKTDNGTLVSGYLVQIYTGNLILYKSDGSTYNQIATTTTTYDYSTSRTFKITHTQAGVITIFIDGVQVLQFTDTSENSGYIGLYSGVSATGTMVITRCEYCYI